MALEYIGAMQVKDRIRKKQSEWVNETLNDLEERGATIEKTDVRHRSRMSVTITVEVGPEGWKDD